MQSVKGIKVSEHFLQNKRVSIVLRGVVDNRAIKTARALVGEGARVTIHSFTYLRNDYEDEPFFVEYHDPAEPLPSNRNARVIRILENLTLKRLGKSILERKYGLFGFELVRKAILADNPDIIHAINADILKGASLAAEELEIPLIYDAYEYWPEHALEEICNYSSTEKEFLLSSEKSYVAKAKAMITVSPYLAKLYKQTLKLHEEPTVIFNAPTNFNVGSLPSGDPVRFLFLGNIQEDRNLKTLFEAASQAEWMELTLQGDGKLKPWLAQEIEKRRLSARVKLKDPVPYAEVADSCKEYDVGILCSIAYNRQVDGALPNKFFEYVAGGLALACTRTSAVEGFPNYESFGTYLDSGNPVSLRKSLEAIASNPDAVTSMKTASIEIAKKYCGDTQSSKLVALYENVISGTDS